MALSRLPPSSFTSLPRNFIPIITPKYCLQLRINISYEILRRGVDGLLTVIETYPNTDYWFQTCEIPPCIFFSDQPFNSCVRYLVESFLFSSNLRDNFRYAIAVDIARSLVCMFDQHWFSGFNLRADSDVVLEHLVNEIGSSETNFEIFNAVNAGDVQRRVGVSRSVISRLKKKKVRSSAAKERQNECVICFEELFGAESDKVTELDCCHLFHQKCVFEWFKSKNTCPICRAEICKQ